MKIFIISVYNACTIKLTHEAQKNSRISFIRATTDFNSNLPGNDLKPATNLSLKMSKTSRYQSHK